jgi:DNA topoisomerase-2
MTDSLHKYKKMDEVEHVLARPGMYLGSTSNTAMPFFVPDNESNRMVERVVEYNPALVKMFDEIISNSVDEHIRSGKVTKIDVQISPLGQITIEDNGGIPVKLHPEHGQYIPSMIFGELRTGSNFNDDERFSAGLNGLGSKLTSVFSKEFRVETSDGENTFVQIFRDNLSDKSEPVVTPGGKPSTKIVFVPDYDRLGCDLDADNIKRVEKRVYDVAGCNPKIRVSLNGDKIDIKSFSQYCGLYVDNAVEYKNEHWHVSVAANTEDSFKQVSFVNGVDTYNGGTHVDYVVNQITAKLREYIKKKHKIDVKPNNIKQQLFVFIDCKVNAPTFTSQTKEFMSSDPKDFGTRFDVSDRFVNKIVKSDVVQRVIDWAEAQQRQKELAELRKMNKQATSQNFLKKIVKFDDATGKNRAECVCAISEGDSAAKSILSARDPKKVGVYPLKGKPLNVRDVSVKRLTANDEFVNLMTILGLKLGESDVKIEDLRFGKLLICADYDPDGSHIAGLVVNMMKEFWPDLIKQGFLYRLKTPLIVATWGKNVKEFFTREQYNQWADQAPKHSMSYYKGLGSFSTKDFSKFMNDERYMEPLVYSDQEDFSRIDLAFDKSRAKDRKDWLAKG